MVGVLFGRVNESAIDGSRGGRTGPPLTRIIHKFGKRPNAKARRRKDAKHQVAGTWQFDN